MLKILYTPIDERPCNLRYPQQMADTLSGIELVVPPIKSMCKGRTAADIEAVWAFVEHEMPQCQEAILSVELLVYGGLVPSRIHKEQEAVLLQRVQRMAKLCSDHPSVCVTASAMVMRVPSYNGNQEEPLYYDTYGARLFGISWYTDKLSRGMGEEGDQEKLSAMQSEVPKEIQADFFGRRVQNFAITSAMLDLVAQGKLHAMVIPQDDTAAYGIQSQEQARHLQKVQELGIANKVLVYPGADEVGCTLLARAINRRLGKTPSVFVRYASTNGANIIPSYEDRPYGESIKAHILSCGCRMVDNSIDADFVLMVNTPGTICTEASQQANPPRTNMTHRSLPEFAQAVGSYLTEGKIVTVSDAVYSNGSDLQLLSFLRQLDLMRSLHGYAGWNTHCNTLGTALCMAVMAVHGGDTRPLVIRRLLEDGGYMAIVRQNIRAMAEEQRWPLDAYAQKDSPLFAATIAMLRDYLQKDIAPFVDFEVELQGIGFPWERSFEIDLLMQIKEITMQIQHK